MLVPFFLLFLTTVTARDWFCHDFAGPIPLGAPLKRALREVLDVLPNCPESTSLDLSYNHMGDEGAEMLATFLPFAPQLTSLNLEGNMITDKGIELLANTIQSMPSLKKLNLQGTPIGDGFGNKGAEHLAKILENCTHLEELLIGFNGFNDDGAKHLAAGIEKAPKLRRVQVKSTSIGADGKEEFGRVSRNRGIKVLHADEDEKEEEKPVTTGDEKPTKPEEKPEKKAEEKPEKKPETKTEEKSETKPASQKTA